MTLFLFKTPTMFWECVHTTFNVESSFDYRLIDIIRNSLADHVLNILFNIMEARFRKKQKKNFIVV